MAMGHQGVGVSIRVCVVAASALVASGCTSVNLKYARPVANDFLTVSEQAQAGYQYVDLGSMYLKVEPLDINTTSSTGGDTKNTKAAAPKTVDPKKKDPNAPKSAPKTVDPKKKPTSSDPNAPESPNTGESSEEPTPPAPTLSSTLIDGKRWYATGVPMPDSKHSFMVRGVSGFWSDTAIAISRYDNSDTTSAVSSKAENLVAKRIGQIAGVAADIVKIAGAVGLAVDSAGYVHPQPLQPFSIRLPEGDKRAIGTLQSEWTYKFEYDSGKPPATVTYDEFIAGVGEEEVGYWPVVACRAATLTLSPPQESNYKYVFNLVIGTTEALRLQPLPVDGKLTPGTVCSSSVTGINSVDPVQTLGEDLTALQEGISKVKDALKPKTDASDPNSPPPAKAPQPEKGP